MVQRKRIATCPPTGNEPWAASWKIHPAEVGVKLAPGMNNSSKVRHTPSLKAHLGYKDMGNGWLLAAGALES